MRGSLFIFSGPAGVGKGTVLSRALEKLSGIKYSVSCTTRAPRPGLDREGETYYFLSENEFRRRIAAGDFLEYAEVHGHLYGTRRDIVESALEAGTDIVLEIDVQGAFIVKEKMPEAVTVFIKPPSMEELRRRLEGRGSEPEEERERRIRNAEREIACSYRYDHVVINDRLEKTVEEVVNIVRRQREERRQ